MFSCYGIENFGSIMPHWHLSSAGNFFPQIFFFFKSIYCKTVAFCNITDLSRVYNAIIAPCYWK